LRALVLRGELDLIRAAAAVERIRAVRTAQYPFEPFSRRIWELRDNLTVYDAWCIALAEMLDTDVLTADVRLASAAGARCRIVNIAESR
jgi:predicted nucleic acid-binding protein